MGSCQVLLCSVEHSAAMASWWHLGFHKIHESCFWQVLLWNSKWKHVNGLPQTLFISSHLSEWCVKGAQALVWPFDRENQKISCFLGDLLEISPEPVTWKLGTSPEAMGWKQKYIEVLMWFQKIFCCKSRSKLLWMRPRVDWTYTGGQW